MVRALSKLYSKLVGRQINERTEIVTTSGAYEALFSAISGHTDVGDEVIVIEPFFDCYEPMIKYAGGTPKFIPLRLVRMLILYPLSKFDINFLYSLKITSFSLNESGVQ